MSEGRPVSNLNQHESIYGTIMEESGNLQQNAYSSSSKAICYLTRKLTPYDPQPEPKYQVKN